MSRRRFSFSRLVVAVLGGVGLLFLTLPIIALLLRALSAQPLGEVPGILQAVVLSLITTFVTMLVTLAFGTPLAYILARWRFPGRRLVNLLVELPIVLPPAVAGLALLVTFGRRGMFGDTLLAFGVTLPFTTAAVVVAQTFVSAPFYIRAAQIGFQTVPLEIEAAGLVDGAAGWALFRYVTFPLTRRALAAGLVLCWARALGEFGATILFAGSLQGRTQTMPLLIYNVLERDINAAIWAGVLLVGMALLALLLSLYLRQDDMVF